MVICFGLFVFSTIVFSSSFVCSLNQTETSCFLFIIYFIYFYIFYFLICFCQRVVQIKKWVFYFLFFELTGGFHI